MNDFGRAGHEKRNEGGPVEGTEITVPSIDRRKFMTRVALGIVGLQAISIAKAVSARSGDAARSSTPAETTFFTNPLFEFMFLVAMGKAYHQAGDIGKLLYIAGQIEDGNYDSAFQAFYDAGAEAEALAKQSLNSGHRVSAREAFMWASNYYYSSTYFLDASQDPSRMLPTWKLSRQCWDSAAALFTPKIKPVRIPYEKTTLSGYLYQCGNSSGPRPLLILNNGSDGSILDMWCAGAAGALARGYNCLAFDGPGQGASLWLQHLYFRPDWEAVITPVVKFALRLGCVDPRRIALLGVSQGGYWVTRAVAFEKRIAAAIVDPGVWNVSLPWLSALPSELLQMLNDGQKDDFDAAMESLPPATQAAMQSRMRPYGITDYYDCFKAVEQYNVEPVVSKITCPMLVTNPENETYFPGQPQQLYDMLPGANKYLLDFTAEQGADLHCEPKASGLRDLKIFDWLDEQFK
jgi:pimeloyl-ACP methyl ester carboxylesterase